MGFLTIGYPRDDSFGFLYEQLEPRHGGGEPIRSLDVGSFNVPWLRSVESAAAFMENFPRFIRRVESIGLMVYPPPLQSI